MFERDSLWVGLLGALCSHLILWSVSFLGTIRLSLPYHMWFPGQLCLSVNNLCTVCLRGQADLCFAVRARTYHWWWSKVRTTISWIECWRQRRPARSRLLRKDSLNEWLITSSWKMNSDDVSRYLSCREGWRSPPPSACLPGIKLSCFIPFLIFCWINTPQPLLMSFFRNFFLSNPCSFLPLFFVHSVFCLLVG